MPVDAIVTPNHQLDLDFLLIWLCIGLSSNDWFGDVKIVLKESVANIPIIGTGVRMFGFLPVSRNASLDLPNMQQWSKEGMRVIFPEGTTLNTQDLEDCKSFAKKKKASNLKWFQKQDNVLTPRIKGLQALVEPNKTTVLDVTVLYGNYTGECPTYDMGYDRETEVLPSFKKVLSGLETGFPELDIVLQKINDFTAGLKGVQAESKSKFSSATTKTLALVKFDTNKVGTDVGKWVYSTWEGKSKFMAAHMGGSWVDSPSQEGFLPSKGGNWVKESPSRVRQPLLVLGLCWAPGFCFFSYIIAFFMGGWSLLLAAFAVKMMKSGGVGGEIVRRKAD